MDERQGGIRRRFRRVHGRRQRRGASRLHRFRRIRDHPPRDARKRHAGHPRAGAHTAAPDHRHFRRHRARLRRRHGLRHLRRRRAGGRGDLLLRKRRLDKGEPRLPRCGQLRCALRTARRELPDLQRRRPHRRALPLRHRQRGLRGHLGRQGARHRALWPHRQRRRLLPRRRKRRGDDRQAAIHGCGQVCRLLPRGALSGRRAQPRRIRRGDGQHPPAQRSYHHRPRVQRRIRWQAPCRRDALRRPHRRYRPLLRQRQRHLARRPAAL